MTGRGRPILVTQMCFVPAQNGHSSTLMAHELTMSCRSPAIEPKGKVVRLKE